MAKVEAKSPFQKLLTGKIDNFVNVNYIDRDKLIELLDTHWPEFYLDRRPFLSQYSDLLKQELIGLNVSEIGDYDKSINSILIPQLLNEKSDFAKRQSHGLEIKRKPIIPSQIADLRSPIAFITGEAGSGKSTLLKRLAIDMTENGNTTPIVISARNLMRCTNNVRSIYEASLTKNVSVSLEDIEKELAQSKIVLLIDALDEVRSAAERLKLIAYVSQLIDAKENSIGKAVISTRPESDSEIISLTKKYPTYEVLPIDHKHINSFFIKWFGDKNKSKALALFAELKRKSILDKLPKTPLTLTLLAILYETKGDVPTTLTELYRMFSDLLLGKWDHKKGIDSITSSQIKFGLLAHTAFTMHSQGLNEISQQDFLSNAQHYLTNKLGDSKADPQDIIQNIIDRSGLLLPSGNKIKFKHFSFQEYFCSQEVFCRNTFKQNLTTWIDDSWWSGVLFFSAGSLKNIDDYCNTITRTDYEDSFTASLAIGGMLQAAYETSVQNKRALILKTRTQIPEIIKLVTDEIEKLTDIKMPRFVPYAIVFEMLSDNYCSSFLIKPLSDVLRTKSTERQLILTEDLFVASSLAKSGDSSGIEEILTRPAANDPIALLICDIMLSEFESNYLDGELSAIHKSVRKKIKRNAKAVKYLLR